MSSLTLKHLDLLVITYNQTYNIRIRGGGYIWYTFVVVDIPLSGTEFLTKIQIYSQMNKKIVTGTNITDKWQLNFSKFKIRNHMGAGKI